MDDSSQQVPPRVFFAPTPSSDTTDDSSSSHSPSPAPQGLTPQSSFLYAVKVRKRFFFSFFFFFLVSSFQAVGHMQQHRRQLEISHDLVHFERPENFTISTEAQESCRQASRALGLRKKYMERLPDEQMGQPAQKRLSLDDEQDWKQLQNMKEWSISRDKNGVLIAGGSEAQVIPYREFLEDRSFVLDLEASGPMKSFTYMRLKLLEHRFDVNLQLNKHRELELTRGDSRDWTQIAKVDTHIHLAAAFTSAHLFSFIQRKLRDAPDDVVLKKDGQDVTLRDLFIGCKVDPTKLSMASLDTQADISTFNRFDNFNSLYNPFGDASLRAVFMKTDSMVNKGRYFAELTAELLHIQEGTTSSNVKSEFRLSLYGRRKSEVENLASWVCDFGLFSSTNRYLIQIPRIYDVWRKANEVKSFSDVLTNIFEPMFEATINPSAHRKIHNFLTSVSGFDCVDDESKADEAMPDPATADPRNWTAASNPPYAYWCYFVYAHIVSLNHLRKARGLHEFSFRPHCGEAGSVSHLADCFLLATNINHGIGLQKSTPLQYLYYLAQIGLAVSPLSNAALFLDYDKNPFPIFFKRGLNVSLSTDDPLQFSYTRFPLIEEYSVAKARFNLSQVDLSEIAANSVRQSGFEHERKVEFLGGTYYRHGLAGNNVDKSNVPDLRVAYRSYCLEDELQFVASAIVGHFAVRKVESVASLVPSVETLFTKVSVSHRGLPFASKRIMEEDSLSCRKLMQMLELRHRYFIPPDHSLDVDLEASRELQVAQRELFVRNGLFKVLHSSADLCSNDMDELASVRCFECQRSYCQECARVLHRAPAMRSHTLEPMAPVVPLYDYRSLKEFQDDLSTVLLLLGDGPLSSLAKRRLKLLLVRYEAHVLLNGQAEKNSMKSISRHFMDLVKVDNHLHTSSAATADHLLDFIKRAYKTDKDVVVLPGKTLGQVVDKVSRTVENMTLDSLGMNDSDTFGRFDKWNALYLPFQDDDMRQTFLRRENLDGGRLYAQLIKEVLHMRDISVYTELRATVRGSHAGEWDELVKWITSSGLDKCERNVWVIQVPRAYRVLRRKGIVKSFGDLIDNLFRPLFNVMLDPSSNVPLYNLLYIVSGFDSVDDESAPELNTVWPENPHEWTRDEEPPYAYWLYFLKANLHTLNMLKGNE